MVGRVHLWASVVVCGCVSLVACKEEPKHLSRTLSAWAHDLDNQEDYKRKQACESLAAIGPASEAYVDKLVTLLDDTNEGVREFCEVALKKIGPAAVPALAQALSHELPHVRLHAAAALVGIDAKHAGATSELAKAFTGIGNAALAEKARGVLVKLGEPAVDIILPETKSSYKPVRMLAIQTMGQLEAKAAAAIPAFTEMLKDADVEVRVEAMKVIAKIAPRETAAPLLEAMTKDPVEQVGMQAGHLLKLIGARTSASGNEGQPDGADAAEQAKK